MVRVLCVIPALPGADYSRALESVLSQTVKVDYVLFTFKKGPMKVKMGARMSAVMNLALSKVRLAEFDYLLRVDVDSILPSDFLEKNLAEQPDYCGVTAGAQIIKVKSFMKLFNGCFPCFSDDTYVRRKFSVCGFKSVDPIVNAESKREGGVSHGSKYYVHRGLEQYRLGYTLVHVVHDVFRRIVKAPFSLICPVAFFFGLLFRLEKRDVFEWTRREQKKRVVRLFK